MFTVMYMSGYIGVLILVTTMFGPAFVATIAGSNGKSEGRHFFMALISILLANTIGILTVFQKVETFDTYGEAIQLYDAREISFINIDEERFAEEVAVAFDAKEAKFLTDVDQLFISNSRRDTRVELHYPNGDVYEVEIYAQQEHDRSMLVYGEKVKIEENGLLDLSNDAPENMVMQ